MENYCDYVPTPEQIEGSRRLDEERKERCKRIKEKYGIFDEGPREDNTGEEEGNVSELKRDIKTSLPVLPSNRRNDNKSVQKKKPSGHKKNNNAPNKDNGQSSLF